MKYKIVGLSFIGVVIISLGVFKKELTIGFYDLIYSKVCIDNICFKKPKEYIPMFLDHENNVYFFPSEKTEKILLEKTFDSGNKIFIEVKKVSGQKTEDLNLTTIVRGKCIYYLDGDNTLTRIVIPSKELEFNMHLNNIFEVKEVEKSICLNIL